MGDRESSQLWVAGRGYSILSVYIIYRGEWKIFFAENNFLMNKTLTVWLDYGYPVSILLRVLISNNRWIYQDSKTPLSLVGVNNC